MLLFFLLSSTRCAPSGATRPADEAVGGPVTLTIGYPHQTGQDPLHGLQQAARLLSFEGLAFLTREGRPRPKLAESWLESPDGLTWSIKLRPDARFHDGSPVDAAAVKESLDRSIGSESARRPGLSDILRVEAPSKTELVIRLKASSTFAIDDLTVSIVKDSNGAEVGTGPFVTTSASPTEIVMTVVPNYYRTKPVIDRIVWRAYPAVRTAWAAMMRGDIDFLYEVAPDTLEFIEPEESVSVFPFLRNYVYAIVLNTKRRPFDSLQVRRALNYAVDRNGIIELALKGKGKAASGPMWPQHWAFDSAIAEYAHDPSRAAALLDAAGIPAVGPPSPTGHAPARLHFVCLVPQNFALWERMALIAQRDFSQIGVDMQFESVTFDDLNSRLSKGDFDAAIMETVVGNSVSRPYLFWHSQGSWNMWGYNNSKVDAALDDIRRSSNEQVYRRAFRTLQTETLDDPPAVFLALGEATRAVSKRFTVVAQPGTDIIATIPDWQIGEGLVRTTN